jgi:hypothetical protein
MRCTECTLPPQEDECPPGRCGKLTKPFLGTYYGAGNYFYVARLLRLASHSGTVFLSADDFAAAAHTACAVPWLQTRVEWNASDWLHVRLGCSPPATLRTQAATLCTQAAACMCPGCNPVYPGCNRYASQVRFGCFSGLYISGLLQHEYGFPRASKQLAIAHTLRGAKVEWALGRHTAPPPRHPAATQAHASADMLPQCCPPPVPTTNCKSLMVACGCAACCMRSRSRAQRSS